MEVKMPGTILFPTDFSDVSLKALDYLKEYKNCGFNRIVLLHVIEERAINAIVRYSPMNFEEGKKSIVEDIEKDLKSTEKELVQHGFDVIARIVVGNPIREILQAEKAPNIDLIVLGSHGKSNLEEIFLGSVSEKVIRRSAKPVLVIKR
jgi:nucleotide-binding universal stress UspA family protein